MARLLIIEDDLDLREGLGFALEMEGYAVESAATMREGLACLYESSWDLIILDCNLPDGDGYELVETVRGFCDTPVFMLTARNTEMDEVKALALGGGRLYVEAVFSGCAKGTCTKNPSGSAATYKDAFSRYYDRQGCLHSDT